MSLISFDFTNATEAACGSVGLTESSLREMIPEITDACGRLEALCGRPTGFFLDLPSRSVDEEEEFAKGLRQRFDNMVVIGIGGSSLGTRAIWKALTRPYSEKFRDGRDAGKVLKLYFAENVDPVEVEDLLDSIDLERTVFNVVTKSGTTIETISVFMIVRALLLERFGVEGYRERVICTTDIGDNALRQLAEQDGLHTIDIPPGVGGRFSALSAVGTLPLLCAGVDVRALLAGGMRARENALKGPVRENAAALFAVTQAAFIRQGAGDVVFMAYISQFADLGEWFVQLWAESLGKRRADGTSVGPTPIPAIGARDQHSLLQLMMEGPLERNVVFVEDARTPSKLRVPTAPAALASLAHLSERALSETLHAEQRGVEAALRESDRPSSTIRLNGISEASIGAFVVMLECATALTGFLLGIDPFDQPGVELGKRYAHGILGRASDAGYLTRLHEDDQRLGRVVTEF